MKEIWWAIVYKNYSQKTEEIIGFRKALIFRYRGYALKEYKENNYSKIDKRDNRQKCGWIIKKVEIKII